MAQKKHKALTADRKASRQRAEKGLSGEELRVGFEFFNMDVGDFHAVKQFLNVALGLSSPVSTSQLASTIADDLSEHVGTTARVDGGTCDACGFATILPLSKCTLLFEHLASFVDLPKAEDTAIVLQERYINLPSPIALQLYRALYDDFERARDEDVLFRRIRHIVFLTPMAKTPGRDEGLEHEYPEAEALDGLCTAKAMFRVESYHETADSRRVFCDDGVEKWRQIYLLPAGDFKALIGRIDRFVSC